MRFTIGLKVFSIAVGLLLLMAVVALLSMRMTRIVDDQLVIIDQNYFPAYVALAQANIRSVEESAYVRRLLLAIPHWIVLTLYSFAAGIVVYTSRATNWNSCS